LNKAGTVYGNFPDREAFHILARASCHVLPIFALITLDFLVSAGMIDPPEIPYFLAGGGDLAHAISTFDWSKTTLGPIGNWPTSLTTTVGLILRSPIPMVTLWGGPGIMIYNDAYSIFAGGRHPKLLGSPVREGWPEVADFNDNVMKVGLAGGVLSYKDQELTLYRSGAPEQVWMNLDYSPVIGESGRPIGVIAVVVETSAAVRAESELRRSEAEVRASEERFQLALSAGNSIGTWDWDVAADRVVADARFASLYNVDPEFAKAGAPIAEFFAGIHPDDAERVQAEVAKSIETGEPFVSEYRLVQPDGGIRWIVAHGRCMRSPDGRPLRFPGASFDITQRKTAEVRREALVTLTDFIRDLDNPEDLAFAASTILGETLKVSRVSYGTIDPDAETLTVDRDWLAPGVESLAGTLHLRDYGSFIDSLKRGEFIAIANVDEDERTVFAAEALKSRSAGAFVNVPVIEQGRLVAVLFLNNAKARQWAREDLALVQEIAERTRTATERLKAVEALRHANATLEAKVEERTADLVAAAEALRQSQKMEAVGQLTGGIAHDFNNLLAGISGSLELLDKRLSQGRLEGVGRYINVAQESARRAASLTQRLLAFARRQTLDPKIVDVNRMIAGMADLLQRSVGPDVHVEVVQAGGLWGAKLDPSQLENAILNLCINARDAMTPNGGRITIETANKWLDDRAAKERDLPPGQYVSLSVSDTGTGMPPDVIEKIFDPFFTTKPLGQGTGLGLSMIYGFVRQSGGQVRVYSEVGKGTMMSLYFPRLVGELSDEERSEDPSIDRGTGETVLVIDDERAIRMVIAEILTEAGYRVIEAEDGPSGLRIVQARGRIDLLITDVGLPNGLNGRQVADAARSINPRLKVLFITGFAENAAIGNGHLDSGMSVITKPFVNTALANKVRQLIDG
jgi:signal transduction histidine kinase/PAS domain-containing protein